MPTNRIRIEFEGQEVKCDLWDANGIQHDCGDIFQELKDQTSKGRENAEIALTHSQNSMSTSIKFGSTRKELVYDVAPAVIEQILQMKGS